MFYWRWKPSLRGAPCSTLTTCLPNLALLPIAESHLHQTLRSGGGGFRRLAVQNTEVKPAQHTHPCCRVMAEPTACCQYICLCHHSLSFSTQQNCPPSFPPPPPAPSSPRIPPAKQPSLGNVNQLPPPQPPSQSPFPPPSKHGLGFCWSGGILGLCSSLELLTLGKCAAYVNFFFLFWFFFFWKHVHLG